MYRTNLWQSHFEFGSRRAFIQFMKNNDEEWNKICELVANESDPQKLSGHLKRLIRALDARQQSLERTEKLVTPASSSPEGKQNPF